MDFELQYFDLTVKDVLKDALNSKVSNRTDAFMYGDTSGSDADIVSNIEEGLSQVEEQGEEITNLEEKRLRNRLAARKCREKRKQRILYLEKICNSLENRMVCLQSEVTNLVKERDSLSNLLSSHWCVSKSSDNHNSRLQSSNDQNFRSGYSEILYQPY